MAKRIITVGNQELLNEAQATSLKSQATAGEGTLTVHSISKFAIDQILVNGEFGNEGSELIKTHAATAPTGSTVTLASNLVKDHPQDTKVYIIPYNQVEFSHSDTVDGAKSVLTTIDIDPERVETVYEDDGTQGGGYYFTRYKNDISTTYADYSDPIPYAGFGSDTVAYLINMVMSETGKEFTAKLTYEMLIDEINACLRFIKGKLKRWSNTQEYNYEVDAATVEDDYTWTLPETYYDKNSNRSCLQVWLEGYDNLTYVDKQEFDDSNRDSTSGKPKYYTIYDGSLYITPKVGADYAALKLYMDFHTDIVEVNSDADEIDIARHDMVKHWLKWSVRNITERQGAPDFNDGDWLLFQSILDDAKRRESSGQKFKWNRQISGINYRTGTNNFEIE